MIPGVMTSYNDLVNRSLVYMRAERVVGENTLANYEHDVRDFSAWLEKTSARGHTNRYAEVYQRFTQTGLRAKRATPPIVLAPFLPVPDRRGGDRN
jgi:site-specific recombinase XerD